MPSKKLFDFSNDVWNQGPEKAWAKHSDPEFHQYNLGLSNYLAQNQKVEEFRQKEIEQRNLNYNSILALSKTAGETDSYASNLFNRISDISNVTDFKQGTEALANLDKEVKDLQERATTKQYGGVDYLADFGSWAYESYRGIKKNLIDKTSDYFAKSDLESYLRKDTLDYDALKAYSTPDDVLQYVKSFLGSKRFEVENVGGPSEEDYLNIHKKAQKSPRETAYKDMLLAQLDVKFKTPGSDYYRDPKSITDPRTTGDIYVSNFQNTVLKAVKETNVKDNLFNESTFLQYDLEKEGLGKAKYKLEQGRSRLLALAEEEEAKNLTGTKPKENPLYKQKIDEYTDAINGYTAREKELDSIYGVKVGDRSGTWNSAYHRGKEAGINFLQFFMGQGRQSGVYDARRALAVNAGYQPEVIDYDKYGNAVLSSQVFYETSTGTKKNWSGFTESGFGMAAEMIPTLILTRGLTGMLETTAGTEALAVAEGASKTAGWATKTLESLNKLDQVSMLPSKVPFIGGPLKIGSRAMTMASVYPTVYERVRQEELKWGGDVDARSRFMAFNEAATEGLGFPEFGGLKVTGYRRGLGAAARTATDIPLTRTQRYLNFMRGGADFVKTATKINFLESMEEEMALFGEYLISKGYEEEYKKSGRKMTTIDGADMMDTFIESFKSGLIYSGLNTSMRHYQITRPDALREYSRYEAAQNPELFKAKLVADFKKNPGSMTQRDLQNGIIEIDNLASTFKSLSSLDNLKDLNTFLDDEDARFNLFTKADQRSTLSMIDFESLTDEQREELTGYKLMSEISDKGLKRAEDLKLRVAELAEKAKEENLTPEEQAEYMKSQQDYFVLKQLSRYKYFNKRDLSTDQVKFLTENGMLSDNSFNFTQEDLNKMISDVDTDILKTEKRAFQYAGMTEPQKKAKIAQAFDDRISLVSQMEDPAELNSSYTAIKRDYEYLDKNVSNVSSDMMDNKKRLMEAYGARFEELTATQENGRNAFENSIAEVSLEEIINTNDLASLHNLIRRLDVNQDHVDSGFLNIMQESIGLAHATIIDNLTRLSPQAKMNALLPIFDKLVKVDVKSFYEPDTLRETFTHDENLKLDISNEEFETLRNNLMEMRGTRRSESIATTGRLDNVDTPAVDSTSPVADELSALANAASVASTEVDEAGDSEKKTIQDDFHTRITSNKTPQQTVDIIKNRVIARFNAQSNRAKSLNKIIDNYLADKDRVKFDTGWKAVADDIQNEIDNLLTSNSKSKRAEDLAKILNEMALWNRSMKKLLLQNPTTTFTPSPVTTTEEAPEGLNPLEVIDETPVVLKESQQKELEQLDSVQQARRARLMQLTSSLKTAAIEYDEKNVKNSDVAVARRVAQLDSLSEEGEIKTKIVNRRQYLRETLGKLFPDKSNQEIEQDLAAIDQFFSQTPVTVADWDAMNDSQKDEFLQPINDLLGKHFFSNNEFAYFIKNKGKGLITQPSVIVTIADEKGKVALIGGYPLELQFTISEKNANKAWPNIPWRNSQRVIKDAKEFSIEEGDVMKAHQEGFKARTALVKHLSENDDADVIVKAELTAGVLIGPEAFQFIGENSVGQSVKLEDFQLAENAATAIFGKRFKFDLGRLYYNNNGNPLIIMNTRITKEDADTLANLVFSNDASVVNPTVLKEYLMSIMNQIDPQSRILLFDGDTYAFPNAEGQMVYQLDQLLKPTLTTGKKGSYKHRTLGKEEFSQLLQKMYYKVDKKYLQDGEREGDRLPRFKTVQDAEGNMVITQSDENYLDYLKRTHQFPVDKEDNLLTLGNKNLYLDSADVEQMSTNKKVAPPVAPKKTPTRPALTLKVNDELQVIPTDQIETALGITQPINADKYNAAMSAMRINPANIQSVEVITKDPQTGQLSTSEYEVGKEFANTYFYRIVVKVGDSNFPVFALKGGLRDNPMTVQVSGTGATTKFNAVSNEPVSIEVSENLENVPSGKMSLEELSAAVEETPQSPANSVVSDSMDASQQKEGKKSQEECKPSSGNRFKNFGKNKPNRFDF